MEAFLDLHTLLGSQSSSLNVDDIMEDDDMSIPDSSDDQLLIGRQHTQLQRYLSSVPYQCESPEEMDEKLQVIIGKIGVCAETKNWLVLSSWNGALHCWLLMRYPISKPLRARLCRLYYELCLLPGIEPRVIHSWVDMLARLLLNKPNSKRKLESVDLQLPWKPLWRALQKEIPMKGRLYDSSRNLVNILLYLAEMCRRYFPAEEIPEMLSTFVPLVTSESYLAMIPVIISFMPPARCHLYMPALFSLWEAFNSTKLDDRLIELVGELSEEHVAGTAGLEGSVAWKDVGIWSSKQWTVLVGKALGSMNVPVGGSGGASTTGRYADSKSNGASSRIKKVIARFGPLAKMLVYSMATDAPIRDAAPTSRDHRAIGEGYLAGSRALDSLDRLMISTESFFHPSNHGLWSISLTSFISHLAYEFTKRCEEERDPNCKTPAARRLTLAIRRAFVTTLRTPALLSMFSKDPMSMNFAQSALRAMAVLEPSLIMPDLLDRAYSGLEVVNETHRTTAVLTMLSGIALPLVSENIWLGGQKHVVPLLEMCIPGIDLNDPVKTVCATMFIISVVQHIKVGDLSMAQSGLSLSSDAPYEDIMDVDQDVRLPDGTDLGEMPVLSREEERILVRESTASFADWVTSFFRRIFALYENLPEEGGKKNMTGGKQEESVLKSLKSTLDILCLHLSDPLFDLVLKLVYDYATTNAKSNAVRAFGQLVSTLARAKPAQTIDKFLPFCIRQIKEELRHGASGIRTTSSHAAVPSDTTFHWNMSIIRGCFGYDGAALLKHKTQILDLLSVLVEKTLSERGYSGTGDLLARILATLSGTYPLNSRFVNTDAWNSPEFNKDHNIHWGKTFVAEEVEIEWHVPSEEEISFVLEILDHIVAPALAKVEVLLEKSSAWTSIDRNDFCRYLQVSRSAWTGLYTLFQEGPKEVAQSNLDDSTEVEALVVSPLMVQAGFALSDPADPRFKRAVAHRERMGHLIHRAATALGHGYEGEDHIDAVLSVAKAIDVYLLGYAMGKSDFDNLQKNYTQARDLSRAWPKQKRDSRLILIKRGQVYHGSRLYMHSLYRRRSALDDQLLNDLVELSLSSYTRVRKHTQAVLRNVCGYYVRSTSMMLPTLYNSLARGTDPDRMKGALYILYDKEIATYAIADPKTPNLYGRYLIALLNCQHEEKPSIQKLVTSLAQGCLSNLTEESNRTHAYPDDIPGVKEAMRALSFEFSPAFIDKTILEETLRKEPARATAWKLKYEQTVSSIIEVALKPTTHWRYIQIALDFLYGLLCRDVAPSSAIAKLFIDHSTSPHPPLRAVAQKGIIKLCALVKIRTYSKSNEELWLDEYSNPLRRNVPIKSDAEFYDYVQQPVRYDGAAEYLLIDKPASGFLTWAPFTKAYVAVANGTPPFSWDVECQPALEAIQSVISGSSYYGDLTALWGQESSKNTAKPLLRADNVSFIKTIAKTFQGDGLDKILSTIDPLLWETDRFKQRAGAEVLSGLLRGSKHWPKQLSDHIWSWVSFRLDRIFAQIKPDTIGLWEGVVNTQLESRDPRRNTLLVAWILSLPLDLQSDSAFAVTKSLTMLGCFMDYVGYRNPQLGDKYFKMFLENCNVGYAEMRVNIAQHFYMIITNRWRPSYRSAEAFLEACQTTEDPLHIQRAFYLPGVLEITRQMAKWKQERLPPPRVNQSEYDKVGLTLLRWMWIAFYAPHAPLMFPYILPMLPDFICMSELSDSSELQTHSQAVMYILSAVVPPPGLVNSIVTSFVDAIKSATSWRTRLNALPALVVFFYRNLISISDVGVIMDVVINCLSDDNVEVREMASKVLSGVVRVSQRQSIIRLKNQFLSLAHKVKLPARQDPKYGDSLRTLHSAILGLCALIESFPYSVETWMPSLTDILAMHATDPPPISTTIRKCASEFKKTHQDTWHKDQLSFNEDQLQNLSTMLVGTSYYA
ncbi:hypothetical protein HETIRDRAFT_469691 [Heterobasidion irregulare TC 32-1]|uniref:ARM repeat-containing protein n=1 Tax=Heterobasidion irregulare (strain TC 32-1) TaxID=747525 RepID=W4KQ83_HETIT|nr:uncharacterized protein HETIRDRAFT_469691 [Heterobasidion irregulare TC 32-1]ETW87560.1 hypothetical protein HETIRDRAFT_469691 [Heterobasidion irregulare TC 32-1]